MPPNTLIESSTHMDRLTQTQDAIDELIKIMYSSLSYLTRKANFKQVNTNIPITQTIPNIESAQVFAANQAELADDFVRKAKQLEYLISILPASSAVPSAAGNDSELVLLEQELREANAEYLEALTLAEALHDKLSTSLRTALDARSSA